MTGLLEVREKLRFFYVKYEMNSLLKKQAKPKTVRKVKYDVVNKLSAHLLTSESMLWADIDCENYYDATLYGFALANDTGCEYIHLSDALSDRGFLNYLMRPIWQTTKAKDVYHALHKADIAFEDAAFDALIAAFLLDASVNDYDKLLMKYDIEGTAKEEIYGKSGKPKLTDEQERITYVCTQCTNMYSLAADMKQELKDKEMQELFETIEMPLVRVLFEMEKNGVHTDLEVFAQIAAAT